MCQTTSFVRTPKHASGYPEALKEDATPEEKEESRCHYEVF